MRTATLLSLSVLLIGVVGPVPLHAGITADQVLVVYNSASADAVTLLGDYLAAHPDIPANNVLDLNNASLLTADVTQTKFIDDIRTPIRSYLAGAGPYPSDIVAIVLIRPFPHRMSDTDNASAGDNPSIASNEFNAGDATFASVDAELVLLWQDLEYGEAGGTMDSYSDNMIDNPYHQSTAGIDSFSRISITTPKTFNNRSNYVWVLGGSGTTRLGPGDLYLVCRIDGTTLADAQAEIDRAQDIRIDRTAVRVILDEYNLSAAGDLDDDPLFASSDPFLAGDDYEETRDLLIADGWDVRYDDTFDFISGAEEPTPLIAYASYGENHDMSGAGENPPGDGTYIEAFTLVPGAIFNTIESYNGRAFNGLGTKYSQEQVADFITAGGTFGVGLVFEPFTFTISDNEFLFSNMLIHGRCWAEAAYASIPALSWQHVVVGDPLGRIRLLGDIDDDRDVDLDDHALFVECMAGPNVSTPPPSCSETQMHDSDLDGDDDVDCKDWFLFCQAWTGPPVEPPSLPKCDRAQLINSIPAHEVSLWRTANNFIRLTFDIEIIVPADGELLIEVMNSNGVFGTNYTVGTNGMTDFHVEVTTNGSGDSCVLEIWENGSVLTHTDWIAVHNTGGWAGVAEFHRYYPVMKGDVDGDGDVLPTDFGPMFPKIPTFGSDPEERADVDGDRDVLPTDFGPMFPQIPTFGMHYPKPGGHLP